MRTKKGVITSAKMTGTVSVAIHRLVLHPIYKKRYRKSKKFLCDSNGMDLYEGDKVVIEECKPLSKNKHFKVIEIIKAAPRVSDVKEEAEIDAVMNREKTGADAEAKAAKAKKDTSAPSASSETSVPSDVKEDDITSNKK